MLPEPDKFLSKNIFFPTCADRLNCTADAADVGVEPVVIKAAALDPPLPPQAESARTLANMHNTLHKGIVIARNSCKYDVFIDVSRWLFYSPAPPRKRGG